MLHQELPRIEHTPLDGWGRWLVPALIAAAALTAAVVLLLFGQPLFAFGAVFAGLAGAIFVYFQGPANSASGEALATRAV